MKICPVAGQYMHVGRRTDGRTDRQRDMTNLIVDFRNFANAPFSNDNTKFRPADCYQLLRRNCASRSSSFCW